VPPLPEKPTATPGRHPRKSSGQMRVQRYISQAGVASRRQAEAMIAEGRVAVNGQRVTKPGLKIASTDTVSVNGQVVVPAKRRWIVFHKPTGVLCTRKDPHGGKTVYDALPAWSSGLRYVGRLDQHTTGLLMLTNDGTLASALAHPSGRAEREYVAQAKDPVTARSLRTLKRGIRLEDGFAKPKRVRRADLSGGRSGIRIVLTEGRNREVRRLLRAVGISVVSLARVRFGPFRLGDREPGRWRPAYKREINEAREFIRRRKIPHRGGKRARFSTARSRSPAG